MVPTAAAAAAAGAAGLPHPRAPKAWTNLPSEPELSLMFCMSSLFIVMAAAGGDVDASAAMRPHLLADGTGELQAARHQEESRACIPCGPACVATQEHGKGVQAPEAWMFVPVNTNNKPPPLHMHA
jgi:hypothetical protein